MIKMKFRVLPVFAIFSCVFRYLNNIYSTTTTERYFIINAIELKLKDHETSLPNYSLNPGQAGASFNLY